MGASKELFIQEQERESLLASSSNERHDYAKAIVQQVADGTADPYKTFIFAKKGAEVFTLIEKNIRPYIASKGLPKAGLELYGTKLVEKSDPTKFDFTVCNDSEWTFLKAQEAELKEKIKARETFLKALKEPIATIEGEVINPPAVTLGAVNFSATLK